MTVRDEFRQSDSPPSATALRIAAWLMRKWAPGHEDEITLARDLEYECLGVPMGHECDRCGQSVYTHRPQPDPQGATR